MLSPLGWASLALLVLYLALFFWGGAVAAQTAGRSIWLFGQASGRDRWAAMGFRGAFGLSLAGPLLWLAMQPLREADPLWTGSDWPLLGFAGHLAAMLGAMLAFAAQMSMGASWRVGVQEGETGALVQGGLFRISRNPTFLGQIVLLAGVGLAIPSIPTVLAPVLFFLSASVQIRSEEAALAATSGTEYDTFRRAVPRWIGIGREHAR